MKAADAAADERPVHRVFVSELLMGRGGAWVDDDVSMLQSAYRHKVPPDTYACGIGFRIVCLP